jgi:hypothetical protein
VKESTTANGGFETPAIPALKKCQNQDSRILGFTGFFLDFFS